MDYLGVCGNRQRRSGVVRKDYRGDIVADLSDCACGNCGGAVVTGAQYGERKHESCMYGTLTPAWLNGDADTLLPLCNWQLPDPSPPAVSRAWGGLVEYDRDCATCIAHKPVGIE
jgi:hypothetical protein